MSVLSFERFGVFKRKHVSDRYGKINEYLESHRKDLDGIYISGGEPLMHEGVVSFLQYAKTLNYKLRFIQWYVL